MIRPIDQARQHIEALYAQKRREASSDLANSINVLMRDVLQDNLPFEFLQNGDDACLTNRGSISFTLVGNQLIISHDGKPFLKEDVEKVCSVAQQKFLDKVASTKMIGQKGVGIKATFAHADEMTVYSPPYCFRFQEKYEAWKDADRANPYPWQIIPIWTDPASMPTGLNPQWVHFILHLRDPKLVEAQLKQLLQAPQFMLFLNRLRKVTLLGHELSMVHTLQGHREISCDRTLVGRWVYKLDLLTIPPAVRKQLQQMNHYDCPDKYKGDDYSLRVAFAFPLGPNGVIPEKDAVLSCYLPTSVKVFPFRVNGDFLLDASRKSLKANPWNAFVIEQIVFRHFAWLAWIARQSSLRRGVLHLLAPPTPCELPPMLTEAYTAAFARAILIVRFIPSHLDPARLLTLSEAMWDRTGFFSAMKGEKIDDKHLPYLINDQLEGVENLAARHPLKQLSFDHVVDQTEVYLTQNPSLLLKVLRFFMAHWENVKEGFKERCKIPNGYGSLSPIGTFYLRGKTPETYPRCLQIPQFPPDFQDPELREWLNHKVRLDYLSQKEIAIGPLADFVRDKKCDATNTSELVRFIFKAWSNGKITDDELRKHFSRMGVLTQAGDMRPLETCYLADRYQPLLSLEPLLPDMPHLFVSSKYLSQSQEAEAYKRFFLILGVTQTLSPRIPTETEIGQLRALNIFYLDAYLKHLCSNPEMSPLKTTSYNDTHSLPNLVYLPYMELLSNPFYAEHFWRAILQNWEKIYPLASSPKFKTRNMGTKSLALSYLAFVVREYPLRTTQGGAYPGKELYSPELAPLVGALFNTVAIPLPLSDEQADFFGFKRTIHPLDCLKLFEKMQQRGSADVHNYIELLKHLLRGIDFLSEGQKADLKKQPKWMLAENNTWQPCGQLKCNLIPGAPERFDREDYVKMVLPLEDMERLAPLMGVTTLRPTKATFAIPGATEDNMLLMELRKKLPLIALCEAKLSNLDPQAVLRRLAEKARPLKIFFAPRIPLAEGSDETCEVALMEDGLYYKRGCSQKKRKTGEKLALYFQLGAKMKTLLPEILSLKEATDLGGKKGIPDFLQERGLPTAQWHALLKIYSAKDLTLEGVAPQSTLSAAAPHPLHAPQAEMPQPLLTAAGAAALPPPPLPEKDPAPQYRMEEIALVKPNNPTPLLPPPDPGPLYIPPARERPAPKVRTAQEKEIDRANGHRGEEFLYRYLIHRITHHEGASFKKSFTCHNKEAIENGMKFHITYQGDTHYTIEVRWLNAERESGLQRDIDILWQHHQNEIKRRHIDVKASLEGDVHFFISPKEWQYLLANPSNYRIYHIANLKSDRPIPTKFKNPLAQIAAGVLHPAARLEWVKNTRNG